MASEEWFSCPWASRASTLSAVSQAPKASHCPHEGQYLPCPSPKPLQPHNLPVPPCFAFIIISVQARSISRHHSYGQPLVLSLLCLSPLDPLQSRLTFRWQHHLLLQDAGLRVLHIGFLWLGCQGWFYLLSGWVMILHQCLFFF